MPEFSLIKDAWSGTFKLTKDNPVLLLPFFIVAVFQSIILLILFYFPLAPISNILVPPVRAFYGEAYIHYPYNFLILPKLFDAADIAISVLIGIIMTVTAIGMVSDLENNLPVSFKDNFKKVLPQFFVILLLWLFSFGIVYLINWIPKFVYNKFLTSLAYGKGDFLRRLVKYGSLFISILAQALFAYFLHSAVIARAKFIQAMEIGLSLSIREYFSTFMLVFVPNIFLAAGNYLKDRPYYWMDKFYPEAVLIVLFAVIFLFFIARITMCISLTLFFKKKYNTILNNE